MAEKKPERQAPPRTPVLLQLERRLPGLGHQVRDVKAELLWGGNLFAIKLPPEDKEAWFPVAGYCTRVDPQ